MTRKKRSTDWTTRRTPSLWTLRRRFKGRDLYHITCNMLYIAIDVHEYAWYLDIVSLRVSCVALLLVVQVSNFFFDLSSWSFVSVSLGCSFCFTAESQIKLR
jgi:hypothetical protein